MYSLKSKGYLEMTNIEMTASGETFNYSPDSEVAKLMLRIKNGERFRLANSTVSVAVLALKAEEWNPPEGWDEKGNLKPKAEAQAKAKKAEEMPEVVETAEEAEAGEAAAAEQQKVKANAKTTWEGWMVIARGYSVGKAHAMRVADITDPAKCKGSKYSKAYSAYLQRHGLDALHHNVRAALLQCHQQKDEINAFRDKVIADDPTAVSVLNHPVYVLAKFKSGSGAKPEEPTSADIAEKVYDWLRTPEQVADAVLNKYCLGKKEKGDKERPILVPKVQQIVSALKDAADGLDGDDQEWMEAVAEALVQLAPGKSTAGQKLYDRPQDIPEQKRGRGRPKGSKNK
jgi:hypothetical protein